MKVKFIIFSFFFFPVLCYPQSNIDTVIADWSGGWCSICCGDSGNYACYNPFGTDPGWDGGVKSFADPVTIGNIITDVSIILYWSDGDCGGTDDAFNLSINNHLIGSFMKTGNCSCGGCDIDTVFNSWSCSDGGLPNYLYGDTNTFYLGYVGNAVCVDKAVIILNHLNPDTVLKASALSYDVACNSGNNGAAKLSVCGGAPPYTYQWSTGDTTEDVSGLSSGSYNVTITDSNGFSVVDTVIIEEPSPLILTITGSDATCQGMNDGNASVSVQGGTPCYSYSWSSGSIDSTATGLSPGTYTVTVTDFNGCQATDSITILNVYPTYYSNTPDETICAGDSILIFSIYRITAGIYYDSLTTVNGCDSIIVTTLNVNSTFSSNTPNVTICTGDSALLFGIYRTAAGTYYDSLTTVNGCDSITATTLTVNPLPTVNLGADTTICNGCSITLDAGAGFANYNWSTGDSAQSIIVDSTGTYAVQVTDTNGCKGGDTIVIDIASGIKNLQGFQNLEGLHIYPNPNTGEFTLEIKLQKTTALFIRLYQIDGRQVFNQDLSGFKNLTGLSQHYRQQIDLSNYSKGVYYVQVVTDSDVITKKVIYQ